jgi:hypothetical protein
VSQNLVSKIGPVMPVALAIAMKVSSVCPRLTGSVLYVSICPVRLHNELSAQYAHYRFTSF